MTSSSLLCALVIVFVALTANAASELPIKVDVNQLIKHPKKYNGKRIDVTGHWVTSCEHCSDLYPSFDAEQKSPLSGNWVYLGKFAPNIEMPKAFRSCRNAKTESSFAFRQDGARDHNTRLWMDEHRVQAN